jgi:UDP-N-acetylmuramoyl-tripeptide--D-alanyl-D-alanine ligase
MIPLTLADVAALAGGTLDGGDPAAAVTGVATDTRRLRSGDLFFALSGVRDGHLFLDAARSAGASGAVVGRHAVVGSGLAAVRVDDPLTALTRLAAAVRDRLGATVVAITGSSGKTCTKDFTVAVLGGRLKVAGNEASFNNEIGVPLTVLAADGGTEVLVAEVGARGAGHIAALMPLLRPAISVVTNVGTAHHGMFGSVEAIAQAKGEIVEALGEDGIAVLNADDPRVLAMASRTRGRIMTFGETSGADVRAEDRSLDDGARARFKLASAGGVAAVNMSVPGEHMVPNALAAATVASALGVPVGEIAERLSAAAAPAGRMQIVDAPGGWRVVDDSYNANPASMAAALRTLVAMRRKGTTWAVLGYMAELGDVAGAEHDRIGRLAVRLGLGRLITVGEDARGIHEAARLEGMTPDEATFVTDADDAVARILASVAPGDVVLVKASRAAGLERVVEAIAE